MTSPVTLVPKPDGSQKTLYWLQEDEPSNPKWHLSNTKNWWFYWQDWQSQVCDKVWLSQRVLANSFLSKMAKEISTLITLDGLYSSTVMPFGMKNASSTFQRLMNNIVHGLQSCVIYIDDAVIYSDTWEEHLLNIRAFLERLAAAKGTVNLTKSDFAHAYVTYLGHIVGQG